MIYPLGGLVLGAVIGALRARQRGGTVPDMLQWGAAFALIFGLIGLFVLIVLQRALT
jgi:uncharacterized membrane protein YjfL (UPF0719 family)